MPVLETLDPADYDLALGTSVGAVNVPEWAAGKVKKLRATHASVTGIGWYMRPRWPWQWVRGNPGLGSLAPLRARMAAEGTRPEDCACPVGFGVYDLEDDAHRVLVWAPEPTTTAQVDRWHDARVASAAIPVVTAGVDLEVDPGVVHRCVDGGMRHVLPDLPSWEDYDAIDAILCSPLERSDNVGRDQVDSLGGLIGRLVDAWIDTTVIGDLARLRMYAAAGKRVRFWAPRWSGSTYDASPSTMHRRLDDEGVWMAANPIVLATGSPR